MRSFRAKTDAGGEFSIENVPPGEYRTLAQQEAYLPSERITLTITDAAAATHKFVLELGGSVAGTVTDTEENPVADVQVWLSSAEGQIVFSRGARTGADGSYALQGLQEGTVNVRVLAQGFMTATKEDIQIFKGRPTEGVDFVLDRGKFISGVVVNALGEPVKNAVVSGSDTNSYKNVKTDQNGEFVLSGFSGDSVNLSVRVTGYVLLIRRAIPANTEDLRFVLHKGGSVEGQAISDMPLKSFVVILYTIPEEGKQRRIARQKISSDPEGHFKVGDIPEGIYTVEVHSKDYIQVRPLTVEVREDSTVSGLQILMRAR